MSEWRRIREQLGLSRQELAARLAVNRKTVRRWEEENPEPSIAYQRQMREMVGDDGQGVDA